VEDNGIRLVEEGEHSKLGGRQAAKDKGEEASCCMIFANLASALNSEL